MFKIFACYGDMKVVKEKIVYAERKPITHDMNITALLEENNFNMEFEVDF